MSKTYPNSVSRTLTPDNKSLATVISRHDKRLTDAELNLIQDIQDYKRTKIIENTTFSGCLSFSPFQYDSTKSLYFAIPTYDILFGGEVVTIAGNRSSDLSLNKVLLPNPPQWAGPGLGDPARPIVVYLEIWLKALDVDTSASGSPAGYAVVNNTKYLYPYGCIDADPSNYILDDVSDPNIGVTSSRVQIQWAIRTAPLSLSYDFNSYNTGLDFDINSNSGIYGRGSIASLATPSTYTFTNMGSINGDTAIWRAGDGNILNSLGTLDGYTYAAPIAIIFQRNSGFYSLDTNPFGCASSTSSSPSGFLQSGISGRLDGKFSDVVYPEDVIDTRYTVSLTGYDYERLLQQGFTDLISGETNIKVAREPITQAIGSELDFAVTIGQNTINNTISSGVFDGFRYGFSADSRTYSVTESRTVNQKSSGVLGSRWSLNDSVVVQLNAGVKPSSYISSVSVQSLINNSDGSKSVINLFGGQISVSGLGSRSVIITIAQNLTNTQFDPDSNPLIITFDVAYAAGLDDDLRKVMSKIDGGILYDSYKSNPLRVFGVSDYTVLETQNKQSSTTSSLYSYNPSYSNNIFGTRADIIISGSLGIQITSGSNTYTQFIIPNNNVDNIYTGLYVVNVIDSVTKIKYTIADYGRAFDTNNMYVNIVGTVPTSSSLIFTILLKNTCQISYNPAVKGLTSIEETVIVGTGEANTDTRVTISSVTRFADRNEIILYSNKAKIKGISGDDTNKLIWVYDSPSNTYIGYKITKVDFNLGLVKITVPNVVNLGTNGQLWKLIISIVPSLDKTSTMSLVGKYKPYQGEGVANREYSIISSNDKALLTTNGTGSAPVVGIKDIYPFNRQLPISTLLPSLVSWSDSDLTNQSLSGDISANYEDKRVQNIEHTISVNMYTNDFIEPVAGFKRKKIKLVSQTSRGFNSTIPNVGYGVVRPKTRTVLGDNLQTTVAPVTLYINNVSGLDTNDGLSKTTAKKTINSALKSLPPIIKHPVTITLVDTGTAYVLANYSTTDLQIALFGDGDTRSLKYYSLANLAFTMQESARLTITKETSATNRITIDGTGASFSDGMACAFVVSSSRVIFNGISFTNFIQPSVIIEDSDVEFLDCNSTGNQQFVSASDGSTVIFNKGSISLGELATGLVMNDSSLLVSGSPVLTSTSVKSDAFFVADRTSNITLDKHDVQSNSSLEVGIVSSTLVLRAQMNSTVSCNPTWSTNGRAILATNSVLTNNIAKTPFLGGISVDLSSNVITN